MATMHRARAVMKIRKRKTASVVGLANRMCNGIDDNQGLFATPNPPTAAIRNQVVIVNTAQDLAGTRAKGAASARDVQRNILVGMVETEVNYIQGVADKSATWDQAVATIHAGGLEVADVASPSKGILVVEQGPKGGSVLLDANVGMLTAGLRGKFFFNWQYTADGKVFVTLPSTPNHTTTVEGLTPLTSYGFRVSVTNAAGIQESWSQTMDFLVH